MASRVVSVASGTVFPVGLMGASPVVLVASGFKLMSGFFGSSQSPHV